MTNTQSTEVPGPHAAPVDDLELLLKYTVMRADVKIDDASIEEATTACAEYRRTSSVPNEVRIWKCLNKLSNMTKPVTDESVKAITALLDDQRQRPGFFRNYALDPPIRRQIVTSLIWMFAVLLLVVTVQIYSLLLTVTLEQIGTTQTEFNAAKAQYETLHTAVDVAGDKASDQATQQLATLDEAKISAESALTGNFKLLDTLTFGIPRKLTSGATALTPGTGTLIQQNVILSEAAKGFVKAVALYLLPLLYGISGANVYILRQLISKLDDWTLTPISNTKYRLRRSLGALLGATIGLLYDQGSGALSSAGFSIAAVAFLGGYSAEFIFSLLDSLITRAKSVFSGELEKPAQGSSNGNGSSPETPVVVPPANAPSGAKQ